MKIIFICGSLEPGRDGVGDYVRQLGGELLRQGHQAAGIALNDQHTTQELYFAQPISQNELPVLRLPAAWPASRRFQRAKQWVEEFQPTWISLQFVLYAFDAKGLPVSLSWYLRGLVRGRCVHLMMHETWVGTEDDTGLKRRLLASLQKFVIRKTISELKPTVIHTHLPIYRTRLQHLGWNALPLPLFSNIPVVPAPSQIESDIFRIGIFSQGSTSGPFISFLAKLAKFIAQRKQHFQVLLIGGAPTTMQALAIVLENAADLHGNIHYTGFLTPVQLSTALQTCHLGLTSVPQQGLGKSGSVAAFLAHGIPVAAPVRLENTEDSIGFFYENLHPAILTIPDLSQFQTAQAAAQLAKTSLHISTIGNTFLDNLAQAS